MRVQVSVRVLRPIYRTECRIFTGEACRSSHRCAGLPSLLALSAPGSPEAVADMHRYSLRLRNNVFPWYSFCHDPIPRARRHAVSPYHATCMPLSAMDHAVGISWGIARTLGGSRMSETVPATTPGSPARRWHVVALPAVLLVVLFAAGCATKMSKVPPIRTRDVPAGDTRKAYNRPYTVKGQRYVPLPSAKGYVESGIASWYGWESGTRTSMGEYVDPSRLTAAHRTLPLPTTVHVLNLDNQRSVVVVVNDRGPFVAGRLIDLSEGAAQSIGMKHTGTARVKVVALPAK